jgi:hypothetical protein
MTIDNLQIGPQVLADGTTTLQRGGKSAESIVQELHGRYAEQMYRGNLFSAANQAAQAVSVALSTTYTGILLYNPVGSGKILIPLKIKYALSAAPAAVASIGLLGGFSATGGVTALTTKLSIQSNQIGNSVSGAGIALSAASIATPTWIQQLVDGFTAASLPAPSSVVDLEGVYGILPGAFLGIGALTAVTGLGSIVWEEIPQ